MKLALSLLALASAALAQTAGFDVITKPSKGEAVPAGKTYTITWEPSEKFNGTVSLELLGGKSPATLVAEGTIATGVDSSDGTYDWKVDSDLGADATYGIQLTLDSDKTVFQFSFPFQITGGSVASSDSVSANPSTSTTSSSTSKTTSSKSSSTGKTTDTTSSDATTTDSTTAGTSGATPATTTPHKVTITSTQFATGTNTAVTVPSNGAPTPASGSLLALIASLAMAVFAL